jgi:hypothetical protein
MRLLILSAFICFIFMVGTKPSERLVSSYLNYQVGRLMSERWSVRVANIDDGILLWAALEIAFLSATLCIRGAGSPN